MLTNVEALQRMKEELLVKGWTQGFFADADGKVCLLGSLTRSNFVHEVSLDGVLNRLHEVIGRGNGVFNWNDTKGRTFNEVMDLLDAAILQEKENNV